MTQPHPPEPSIRDPEHAVLEQCVTALLWLITPNEEDLFAASAIFDRVFQGSGQGGEGVVLWEITRWKHRAQSEAGELAGAYPDEYFLVWVGEDSTLRPHWRAYPEDEFRRLFSEGCSRFAWEHPIFRKAIGEALIKHGMHLS